MSNPERTIAYLDCFAGISGDMVLGALLDAGLPEELLREGLAGLGLADFTLERHPEQQGTLQATKVTVKVGSRQPHRSWHTIRTLLEQSALPERAKQRSLAVFELLAAAEAKIHGCRPAEVHFHEVGGTDAIVDIAGVCCGLDYFQVDRLVCSPLPMPRGWVECAHGLLPVPAPAVCELLREVPVYGEGIQAELVTPTGAALVKALSDDFGPFPSMILTKVGYGAGTHQLEDGRPNLLRLVLGRAPIAAEQQEVEVIETHLDDWSPEGYPYLSEVLFEQGALDVAAFPAQMKKGRPGLLLRVVAAPDTAWELKRCLLSETTAIGLRYRREQRWTLPRVGGTVLTPWGAVQVKKIETPAGPRLRPEYEDCRRVSKENGVPLWEVYAQVERRGIDDFCPAVPPTATKEKGPGS